jgi:hypothetical protein
VQTPTRGPQDHVPAAPHATKPPRREQDLIVIPEATEPRRWTTIAAIVAGALALVLIVALAAFAIDQRNRANDLDAQLTEALDDQAALIDAATVSRERVGALETRVGVLEGDLQRARQGKDVAAASRQEARRQLREARRALDDEQARFRSYMGPLVGDGSHVGRLMAVGADQSPARVTLDLGRWFTGAAATQAALDDGVIVAGESLARYFRNDDATWRTLPLDTFATVSVRRWGGGLTYAISTAELQQLMRTDSRSAHRITNDPFRFTVTDGRITALTQLRYP